MEHKALMSQSSIFAICGQLQYFSPNSIFFFLNVWNDWCAHCSAIIFTTL
uniref:Uncharacterized protein n=1 Tax=Anguilla anguilla TaxID=7936 RepID=A0A0E9TWW0_ANGAN